MKFCQETLKCSSKGENYQQRGSHVDFHNICGPRKSRKPEIPAKGRWEFCVLSREVERCRHLCPCAFKHETIAAGEMQAQGVVHVSCARATYSWLKRKLCALRQSTLWSSRRFRKRLTDRQTEREKRDERTREIPFNQVFYPHLPSRSCFLGVSSP